MALEAVVYPQHSLSNYAYKDCNHSLENWNSDFSFPLHGDHDNNAFLEILKNNTNSSNICVVPASSSSALVQHHHQCDTNHSSPETCTADQSLPGRRKRRRTKSGKNKEEIENQRMTHIAVERNRRKQMNEYLAVLRTLMPPSYVQRGDQASIVGGAINFVKELEQLLQTMEGRKRTKQSATCGGLTSPFAGFFSFPQHSTRTLAAGEEKFAAQSQSEWGTADIEVRMAENHASIKLVLEKRPGQVLKMVAGLQGLKLSVLHLNVAAVHHMVLYSVSVKVEEGCNLNTVDEMAAAVNQLLHCIHEEEAANSS